MSIELLIDAESPEIYEDRRTWYYCSEMYFLINGEYFPYDGYKDWTDEELEQWILAIRASLWEKKGAFQFRFREGPFRIDIQKDDCHLYVKCIEWGEGHDRNILTCECTMKELVESLLEAVKSFTATLFTINDMSDGMKKRMICHCQYYRNELKEILNKIDGNTNTATERTEM